MDNLDDVEIEKWGSIQIKEMGGLFVNDVKTILDQLDPAWDYEVVSPELGDRF